MSIRGISFRGQEPSERRAPPSICMNCCMDGAEVSYGGLFGHAATHLDCGLSTKRLRAPDRTPAGSMTGSCPDC